MTVEAFARQYGLIPSVVREWCERGRLKAARVGDGWMIRTTRTNEAMARRKERGLPSVSFSQEETALWPRFERGDDLREISRAIEAKLSSVRCAEHRWKVKKMLDNGDTISEAAREMGVSRQRIAQLMQWDVKL